MKIQVEFYVLVFHIFFPTPFFLSFFQIEPHRLRTRKPHEKLYAIGGWDGNTAIKMVECYDTETGVWETGSPTHIPRNGVGLAILNGLLYAIGGHDGQRFQNTVEVFDPRMNRWKMIAPLKHRRASAGMLHL